MYHPMHGSVVSPQPSYFMPTSPVSPPKWNMNYFSHQPRQSPPFQPTAHSSLIHTPGRFSRKPEDPEPMSTSPLLQHQSREFLPSFLTGETHHSSLTKPVSPGSPERRWGSSISFPPEPICPTAEKGFDQEKEESLAARQGPPISGIGRVNESKQFSPLLPTSPNGSFRNLNSSNGFLLSNTQNISGSGAMSHSKVAAATSTWVTVFGFPSSSTANIIAHFSQYGTIRETKTNPGSNWIHLKYSNIIEVRRALYKNGTIVFGNMMVGVVPCDEEMSKEGLPSAANEFFPVQGGYNRRAGSDVGMFKENINPSSNGGNPQHVRGKMRHMGRDAIEMQVPRQKTGFMSWALDSLFGW